MTHPRQQHPQAVAGNGKVFDQAIGHEAWRHEIRFGTEFFQGSGGLATNGGNAQIGRTPQQAAAPALQPLFYRLHSIGTGYHQPVEVLQL